jgi:hypothetical protein
MKSCLPEAKIVLRRSQRAIERRLSSPEKTANEILDEVRQIFPHAKIVREPARFRESYEPPPSLITKKCIVCRKLYRGWPESQFCLDECAAVEHRAYKNPSTGRIKFLRRQCQLSWRRTTDPVAPMSFRAWLRNFGAFIERMRAIDPSPATNENDEGEAPFFEPLPLPKTSYIYELGKQPNFGNVTATATFARS